jgi:hypothetical protein
MRVFKTAAFFTILSVLAAPITAGVSKEIQTPYIQQYRNKAMFLKVPIHGIRQTIHVGAHPVLDRKNAGEPLAFKVGDQVRITDVNFKGDFIRFKVAAVDFSVQSELVFQFALPLATDFPNKGLFDEALSFALTSGSSYREIDTAKESFIKDEFDSLIQRFANTTGTSTEYVIQTISEKNPEFLKMQSAVEAKETELTLARQETEKEAAKRREAESQTARLRREFEDIDSRITTLQGDQTRTQNERDRYQRQARDLASEVEKLKGEKGDNQKNINKLMKSLDLKTSSNAELDQQVKALSRATTNLKSELTETKLAVEKLETEKADLNSRVIRLEDEKSRLSSNLRALTSDKKSINSRFLKMKEQKEILETADSLLEAMKLTPEEGKDGYRTSGLYLHSAKIGTLEVEEPREAGAAYLIRLSVDSPDTVKFSEEERRLHVALGEKLQVETSWIAQDQELSVALEGSEMTQAVSPRDSIEWNWNFSGELSEPVVAGLSLRFKDSNDQTISLPTQEFMVHPPGIGGLVSHSYSLWSVVISFILGAGGAVVLVFFKSGRRGNPKQPPAAPYVAEKRL